MPRLLSSTETADNSVLSDCAVFEASRVLIICCIGGAVLAIGTPLEYVQGSRCDLVCSSGACDVSCSKKLVCCFCSCDLCLYQCLGPPTSLQPVTHGLQCRHLNMQPPNITTSLSSPYVSGHFHWICFARVNNGWSQVRTGVWPGLRC